MTHYEATPEQWHELEKCSYDSQPWAPCILELCARVKQLEDAAHKHIVETSSNIVALFTRVESLEAAERQASKVYEISKPLQLTPEQAQQVNDLLAPNSKPTPNSSQVRGSLMERVADAIAKEDWMNNGLDEFECEDPDPTYRYTSAAIDDGLDVGSLQTRAAIREVAAWMREQQDGDLIAATMLEREAER